jgi:tight adherence protein B
MGAVVGALFASGLLMIVSGVRGVDVVERAPKPTPKAKRIATTPTSEIVKRVVIAVVLCGVFWWLTGWPMAGVSAASISLVVPLVAQAQRDRDEQLQQSEDIARWCEMVRDSMKAGSYLKEAIDATAQSQVSGRTIRKHVRNLADRCDEMPITAALRVFADEVADPICDQIVLSLILCEEQGGKQLVEVLDEIVASVRRRAAMRRRVETGRARTYAATRAMVVMTILIAVLMTVFASGFMEPFDSPFGQLWMGVVGAAFTAAVWAMVPMSRPEPEHRLIRSTAGSGV